MPTRLAGGIAAVALALLWGGDSSARAGHLFKRHCHSDCNSQAIQLPAQRVLVETAPPRVTVRETTRPSRSTLPVVGTIFMPMAMPLAMPLAQCGGGRDMESFREEDANPLRSAQMAELYALRHEQARAAFRAEVEAKQRILQRMTAGRQTDSSSGDTSALETRLKEIDGRIQQLADRIGAVEKLLVIHDNYLRGQMQQKSELIPRPKDQDSK
jgi:hypothetical protein